MLIDIEMHKCCLCDKYVEVLVIDRHVTYPTICNDCMREIVASWQKEGIPICNELKPLIEEVKEKENA